MSHPPPHPRPLLFLLPYRVGVDCVIVPQDIQTEQAHNQGVHCRHQPVTHTHGKLVKGDNRQIGLQWGTIINLLCPFIHAYSTCLPRGSSGAEKWTTKTCSWWCPLEAGCKTSQSTQTRLKHPVSAVKIRHLEPFTKTVWSLWIVSPLNNNYTIYLDFTEA